MTKPHWISFLKNVFFPNAPKNALFLADQWSTYKDTEAIANATPKDRRFQLALMPAGSTYKIQPLDVYFFRPLKDFVRKFEDHVLLDDLDVKLFDRDNILKLQSIVHNQFSAPRFENLIKYAWYKAGYLKERPGPFQTPVQYCYKLVGEECNLKDCENDSFIKCGHCELELCFDHFYLCHHFCDS